MTLPSRVTDRLVAQLDRSSGEDLSRVLGTLCRAAEEILSASLTGVYLTGSFALGQGDAASDVDFLVVADHALTEDDETAIRGLHRDLPERGGYWAQHLEGSWVDARALRDPVGSNDPWLYVDNGSREMEFSRHDDSWNSRWLFRDAAIALTGPPPAELVPEVDPGAVRSEAAEQAEARARWVRENPHALLDGWAQPYVVLTHCRLLWAATFGTVTSKNEAARWVAGAVAPARYRALIDASVRYRSHPFEPRENRADPAYVPVASDFIDWATGDVRERAALP